MAGVGRNTVVVDPVAAMGAPAAAPEPVMRRVRPEPAEPAETAEPAEPAQAAQPECPYGHEAPQSARFCPECGTELGLASSDDSVLPGFPDPRPRPDSELSAAELAQRERDHQAALRAGRQNAPAVPFVAAPPGQESVLIHMVEDGLTAFGAVWFRGQEVEVAVNGPRWADAQRWILQDDREQMARYGRVMFRPGPWPGLPYGAAAGQFQTLKSPDGKGQVAGPTPEQLAQAEAAEARRRRGVPAPARA